MLWRLVIILMGNYSRPDPNHLICFGSLVLTFRPVYLHSPGMSCRHDAPMIPLDQKCLKRTPPCHQLSGSRDNQWDWSWVKDKGLHRQIEFGYSKILLQLAFFVPMCSSPCQLLYIAHILRHFFPNPTLCCADRSFIWNFSLLPPDLFSASPGWVDAGTTCAALQYFFVVSNFAQRPWVLWNVV